MTLFDLIYLPLACATAPWWMGKKRSGWSERFGRIESLPAPQAGRPRILLHGVSVGEVSALRGVVPLLSPHFDVVVTATTDTGLARAHALFDNIASVRRFPLDLSWSVDQFLDSVRPNVVTLVELEVWPNFVARCHRRNIPVAVINGRLSARSFRGYSRIRSIIAPSFRRLAVAAVQDDVYAERFRSLGVPPERIQITGSMKWDAAQIADHVTGADELAAKLGIDRSKPLVVAGSTGPLPAQGAPIGVDGRDGRPTWCEEALLHASCPEGVQLLCAPRKPERFEEAARAMPGCVRRSQPTNAPPGNPASGRFLLDSIGELRAAYSLADVAIVGRSFGLLHGSDPIEPVALGKPTLIGPRYGDFEGSVGPLVASGGLKEVSAAALRQNLEVLIGSPLLRSQMGEAGRECVRREMGASQRHAAILHSLLTPQ
ncbi:MAG: glycosyltransferase N-terminal domain-containing protein [bacterium]|nr:glycosyltransferase N-terminal domain-containing protein [bacterium]